ncbi:hypothetical protein AAG906_005232 [Vitis piasezkii]
MEGEASWINHCLDDRRRDIGDFGSFSEIREEVNKEVATVSVDLILPNDLLERILAYLPIASILRAGSVCKRWHEIVSSKRFYGINLISYHKSLGISCLPALMNHDSRSELYICNPVTKRCKRLEEPPGLKFSDYSALAISVNRISHHYTISIVKSKQVPGNFFQWDLSIHIYDSETMIWVTALTEVVTGWRAGDESVICDGVLYFLIYSTGGGAPENRHGLIMYNLLSRSSHGLLIRSFIPGSKHDRPDIIKGIGIWVLNGKEWQEVARMPHKFFQGFGEFDDVFASSGTDDLIYIQSYGAPHLLGFDINLKQWKWSQKCPVVKRFPLQLFTGFCFEPRLEIAPFGGIDKFD